MAIAFRIGQAAPMQTSSSTRTPRESISSLSPSPKADCHDPPSQPQTSTRFDARTFKHNSTLTESRKPIHSYSAHIPQFFGTAQATAVHDSAGADVSNEYLLDACYVVQRLEGVTKSEPSVRLCACTHQGVCEALQDSGYQLRTRLVCIQPGGPERFVVIDFTTREIEMPW